ncbi:MAG: primosomal protein N' [Actinobacteria bacterium]|nr:primosomal protein N' [Actinomycetota bacterium]
MTDHPKYASVYIDIKALDLDHGFDYLIPEKLAGKIKTGSVVLVPVKGRIELGYVVGLMDYPGIPPEEVKPIEDLVSPQPVFDKKRLELIRWMSSYYIQPLGSVIRLFLPPGRKTRASFYRSGTGFKYVELLSLNYEIYNRKASSINWEKRPSQKKILDYLINESRTHHGNSAEALPGCKILKSTGSGSSSLKALLDDGFIKIQKVREHRDFRYTGKEGGHTEEIILNEYQEKCVHEVSRSIVDGKHHKYLIQGVTGSGKTEIYIRICRRVLKNSGKALILTPEISLTPQLYRRFEDEFGGRVAVYHSNMSDAERYERWLDIWEGKIAVIIGTRSALFTPVHEPGVIIMDEEHDPSYKENSLVRYNTRDVAEKLAEILGIPVVMGSATPSVVTMHRAQHRDDYTMLKIPVRASGQVRPHRELIDLRGIDHIREDLTITRKLYKSMKEELDKGNKVIIFINRRGFSNFVICRNCGHVPLCPDCDLSYSYHQDRGMLVCHHCGREEKYTGICPNCNKSNMFLYGTGIQKVESKIRARFRDIPVMRMDSDITTRKKSHEDILDKFSEPGSSILVGTQMIAKGLDIPDVTLVGVINCDSMLGLPDFHMNERVYQLITQVSGRAGRKDKQGRVLVQTYRPQSAVMRHILDEDYEKFYYEELKNRNELRYPPFSNLVNIIISGSTEEEVKKEIKKLFTKISHAIKINNEILGPAPAPFSRINRFYRWHILIKTQDMEKTGEAISGILKKYRKARHCRIIVDVDPAWIL